MKLNKQYKKKNKEFFVKTFYLKGWNKLTRNNQTIITEEFNYYKDINLNFFQELVNQHLKQQKNKG